MTTANELKLRFVYYVNNYTPADRKPELLFKAALGAISKASGGEANRKLVQKALTGKTSSREMNDAEKYALCKFAAPAKIGGHWASEHGMFLIDMCHLLLEDMARQDGQVEMFAEGGGQSSDNVGVGNGKALPQAD